jgi:hypothetical protein
VICYTGIRLGFDPSNPKDIHRFLGWIRLEKMARSTNLLESISKLTERLSSMEAKFDKLSDDLGAL